MADKTAISWTQATWNPVSGCTPVSEGCEYCYARKMTRRFGRDFSKVTCHPDRLNIPLKRQKPTTYFMPSMGDAFHEEVPDEFLDKMFGVMAMTPWHTYLLLTKRVERMHEYVIAEERPVHFYDGSLSPRPASTATKMLWAAQALCDGGAPYKEYPIGDDMDWPLPNVWLLVTAENQKRADERIPILLATPAAKRGVSCEPLLGPLSIEPYLPVTDRTSYKAARGCLPLLSLPRLDWVIVGGESGGSPERALVERCPMEKVRHEDDTCALCHGTGWRPKPDSEAWVIDIRMQCAAAGVPFHFKGWGGPRPTSGGHLLDGREHREVPA